MKTIQSFDALIEIAIQVVALQDRADFLLKKYRFNKTHNLKENQREYIEMINCNREKKELLKTMQCFVDDVDFLLFLARVHNANKVLKDDFQNMYVEMNKKVESINKKNIVLCKKIDKIAKTLDAFMQPKEKESLFNPILKFFR
jgi:hypothetical protein